MSTSIFPLCLTLLLCSVYGSPVSVRHFSSEADAGAGEIFKDIPQINLAAGLDLFQGDILLPKNQRNALRNETYRWKFPIPYILGDDLDLNAKAVILQAFEMFRLKSCIDFKPYEGERTHIFFSKQNGCWSMVGDLQTGQNLSIGSGCDYRAIVEHEILHALGFYHEQSRMDRDDYVNIWWDEIIPGKEHNFAKYDDTYITDLNTPYDYESLMHYEPLSFNKNVSVPTITAKIPAFDDIIGQRLDLSAIDLERLNRMYNCTSTHTFLDQCSFELENICGMIQGTNNDQDWVHQQGSVTGQEDHTLSGRCRDAGYFMYFNTNSGQAEEVAILESRILYPRRTQQCLQFFYRTTGSPSDKLIIWLKEDDGTGNIRKMRKIQTFQADSDSNWKIAHVTLNAQKKFRYLFQGLKGNPSSSSGGIAIDDVTLTEVPCPTAVWVIRNFSKILENSSISVIESPRFYSPEGYGFGISVFPNYQSSGYARVAFHLCSGENDAVLEWPALNRQATLTVLDQDPDVLKRMSSSKSFTTSKDHVNSGDISPQVDGMPAGCSILSLNNLCLGGSDNFNILCEPQPTWSECTTFILSQRCVNSELFSLEKGRLYNQGDLIVAFQYLRGACKKNGERLKMHRVPGQKGIVFKLKESNFRLDIRKKFFTVRMVETETGCSEKLWISHPCSGTIIWDKPSIAGRFDESCNCNRSVSWGWSNFISHSQMKRRSFLKNDDLIIFAEFNDIIHLNKTEVPVEPVQSALMEGLILERQKRAAQDTEPVQDQLPYLPDPCHPNPCQNGGVCVTVKGEASCRCPSGQAFFFSGERCQSRQIHGNILGISIGGVAGTIVLTIVLISMMARR